jgi:predicted Zn-dependent protease
MLSLLRATGRLSVLGLLSLLLPLPTLGSPPQKAKPQVVSTALPAEPALPPFRFEGPLAPALTALRQGKPAEAKLLLDKLRPTSKDAKQRDELESLCAESQIRQGQVREAIRGLEAVVSRDPKALMSRVTLGEAYRLVGERDKERAIWNGLFDDHDADRLDMNDCRTVRLVGLAARYLGSYQDAYEQLKNAAELAKEQKRTDEFVLASLSLSELRIEKYEVGYAEVSVKEALRRDPQNPDAKALLARITLEQGNDVSAANELADEAIQTNPHHPLAIQVRAEMLIDNEQYEDALAMLEPAIARNGYDLPARALRAGALLLLDRRKDFDARKDRDAVALASVQPVLSHRGRATSGAAPV